MNGMNMEVQEDWTELVLFVKSFPGLKLATLSSIAKQGRKLLRSDFLSGQALNLKKGDKDKRGRYLISGKVSNKGNAITFSSYPTYLFEKKRVWKKIDRKSEPARHIIKGQFKSALEGKMQSFASKSLNRIIAKQAARV
jgi:hypothetical protein